MVAQEHDPLAGRGNGRSLCLNVIDGKAVTGSDGHEEPWHQGEMKGHVAFIPIAKVCGGVLRPLVGLGEEHAVGESPVNVPSEPLQERVCLRQVLTACPLAFVQVRHGIQAQSVHAKPKPEVHHLGHGLANEGVVVVQVGLVRVEAVPVVGAGRPVPGPVGRFEIFEDNACVAIPLGRVAPDVEVALARPGLCLLGTPKPRVFIGCVVEHQLGDDFQPTLVRLTNEGFEVPERAVVGVDPLEVSDVIAAVLERGRVIRQKPDRRPPRS